MSDLEHWVALSMVPDAGPVTQKKLLSIYGNPEAVFNAPLKELLGIDGISRQKAGNLKGFSDWKVVKRQIEEMNQIDAKAIVYNSPEYPAMLKQVDNSPIVLYLKGTIREDDKFAIAVVGPRKPTTYGSVVAERLTTGLAESGFTIVSGMARGIDTVAHMSSIKSGGRTIAVLGSGLDVPYPPENRGIMKNISDSGCVVSEFPFGTKPLRENFPARNRLISGLSLGVLVIEATQDSGSLITAHYALEQNREVFAVPGNINSPNSEGTNELIKRGAKLIQKTDDIIGELAPVLKGFIKGREKKAADLSEEEHKACDILAGEPMHIDTISRELAMPVAKALVLMLDLELKGVARQADGKRFYLVQ